MASKKAQPRQPCLLNANKADSSKGQTFATANITVESMLDRDKNTLGRKRASYHVYLRHKGEGKDCQTCGEDGLKRATQLAVKELDHNLRESTVQIHNAYQKHLASARLEPQDVVELPTKQYGCPLYLG